MKYLQSYDSYNESIDYQLLLESYNYELLLEGEKIDLYKSIHKKTVSKFSLNLYFVGTFQMGITVLYPIIESLVKNSDVPGITSETIVLMTIFSIAQILNVFNEDVKKIQEELGSKNLLEVTKRVKSSLLSIYKIFSFVSRSFGKIVDVFTDMISYVSLCVPTALVIGEWVSKDGINLDTLPQKVMAFGAGAGILGFKHVIENIIGAIKNKIRGVKNKNEIS